MPIRNSKPVKWSPKGCTDAIDGSTSFKGAMSSLQNLIPDPTTDNVFIPRPASVEKADTGDEFTDPTGITALYIVGDLAYGMVSSADVTDCDVPFCYDLENDSFIEITGADAMNSPATQSTTGNWTPPTMDKVGVYIVITHPGYDGSSNFFGWIDATDPTMPTYDAGNTGTNVLPGVPAAVANFNGRAYFAVGNQAWYSDVLDPLTMTTASQAVTLGDTTPIVALRGNPLTVTTGGVIQSLMAFKNTIVYQITGDKALNTLAENAINVGVGTFSPLSISPTTKGLAFISSHGLRFLDLASSVSEVIGDHGTGIVLPFLNATTPSRVCGAFNADTLRISVESTDINANTVEQEWWFDMTRAIWTGPHTFASNYIYQWNDTFIIVPMDEPTKLFVSDTKTSSTTTYIENGDSMQFSYATILLPDTELMSNNSVVETSIGIGTKDSAVDMTFIASDENGNTLSQIQTTVGQNGITWGNFIWGSALWPDNAFAFKQIPIYWDKPLVFRQMIVQATGLCTFGFKIGNMFLRYQPLGYQAVI